MDAREWDRRYTGRELLWTAEANRFVVAELSDLSPGRALDLACGEGRNSVWLAERGWDVLGVDFSEVALGKARELARHRGVEVAFESHDLAAWAPPEERFDLAMLIYLQVPWPTLEGVLQRAAAALAPGGTLLVVGHDLRNLADGVGGPQDPAVLYTPEQVAGALSELDVVKAERVLRPVDGEHAIDNLVRATRPYR